MNRVTHIPLSGGRKATLERVRAHFCRVAYRATIWERDGTVAKAAERFEYQRADGTIYRGTGIAELRCLFPGSDGRAERARAMRWIKERTPK